MGKCIRCGKEDFILCDDGSCRIKRGRVEGVKVSPEPDITVEERYVAAPEKPNVAIKKRFRDTAFGRTILLKNKTGKYGLRVLLTVIATVTGVNVLPIVEPLTGGITMIDFIMDFGLLHVLITAAAILVTAGVSWLAAEKKIPKWLADKVEATTEWLADELKKATDAKSESGSKITKSELRGIVGRGLNLLLTKKEPS